ncbi:MAG: sugar transferase [Candidatus Omnitrophota bacterium]
MYPGKRLFDFILSFLGIVILSPLLVVISLLILFSAGRPVVYVQKRLGKNWQIFKLYKFRTMVQGAEKQGYLCKKDDPRVTVVGRMLRRYKLDELPQLFNVLKGEMSLVGPRPEVLEFARHYKAQFEKILTVKPGITDPASIRFRDETNLSSSRENAEDDYVKEILPQKIRINFEYIKEAGIFYDLKLILETLACLVFRK